MTEIHDNNNGLRITDAHVHFWDLDVLDYPWLDDVPAIRTSFGLADYEVATTGIPISDMIFVQCECLPDKYQAEVDYITALAAQDRRIKGIVAYFPLETPHAETKLRQLLQNKLVKGIRRLEEEPTSLYRNPAFVENMQLLNKHNLSFDLGVKAQQLPEAIQLVSAAPDNRYILDHCGKPPVKSGDFVSWRSHIKALAAYPQVYCKLSGLVTEADWQAWSSTDLRPYADTVLEYFGTERLAFGGDWPVVTLASNYVKWHETAHQLFSALTPTEIDKVFHRNALDFYQINENT